MRTTLESNNTTQGRICMSTSLLYHGFGIRGYRYVRSDYLEGEIMFTMEQERYSLRCSACGSVRVTCHGGDTRLFRSLPIGSRRTHVLVQIRRVECHDCRRGGEFQGSDHLRVRPGLDHQPGFGRRAVFAGLRKTMIRGRFICTWRYLIRTSHGILRSTF